MSTESNIARHPAAHAVGKNIIAVASGKGGVGKTWFAITLSHALALSNNKVLLFDGDLGLANVDIQLGLMPKHDVADVVAGKKSMAETVTRFPDGGFDIIAGRSGTGSLASLGATHLETLRNGILSIAQNYDMVVLDLAAGIDEAVRSMAGMAGTSLIVTTDEPTAITDAYAMIKLLAAKRRAEPIKLVINAAKNKAEGNRTYETLLKACQSFLKISPPLAGIVRRDSKVKDSIRRQTPLFKRHPTSAAAEDVAAIARTLTRER